MAFGEYLKELRKEKSLSQRVLSEKSGVSNAEISRIESGERLKPSPDTLRALAPVLCVQYEELMEKAGYLNNANEILTINKPTKDYQEKFIEIITPKLIKEGWAVEGCSHSNIADLLAKKKDINWYISFKYIGDYKEKAKISMITQDILIKTYGKLAVYNVNLINKFTLVINNQSAFDIFLKLPPLNLKMNISILLVDFENNSIVEERELNV